jgi:hypothetical protein
MNIASRNCDRSVEDKTKRWRGPDCGVVRVYLEKKLPRAKMAKKFDPTAIIEGWRPCFAFFITDGKSYFNV